MLALLGILSRGLILIGKRLKKNLCYIILFSTTFQLKYINLYNLLIELSKGGINSQHSMLAFQKKTPLNDKKCTRNIANIYVINFANYHQLWFLIYRRKIYPTLYGICSTILLKKSWQKFLTFNLLALLSIFFRGLLFTRKL